MSPPLSTLLLTKHRYSKEPFYQNDTSNKKSNGLMCSAISLVFFKLMTHLQGYYIMMQSMQTNNKITVMFPIKLFWWLKKNCIWNHIIHKMVFIWTFGTICGIYVASISGSNLKQVSVNMRYLESHLMVHSSIDLMKSEYGSIKGWEPTGLSRARRRLPTKCVYVYFYMSVQQWKLLVLPVRRGS